MSARYDVDGVPLPDYGTSWEGEPPVDDSMDVADPAAVQAQDPGVLARLFPGMQAGGMAAADPTANIRQYADAIAPYYQPQQAAPLQKTPPLAMLLAGLTEAAGLASHLRKGPHQQYRLLGRHGEKFMSGGRAEAPQSQAPPVGSTIANLLAAPRMQQRHDQARIDPINAARQNAMAENVANYAGAQMAVPKPPPEPAILTGYRAAGQLEDSGAPGTEHLRKRFLAHALNETSQTKLSLDETVASLRAQGKKDEADGLLASIKAVADARRGPQTAKPRKTPEQIVDEIQAKAIDRERLGARRNYLTTLRQRRVTTQQEIRGLEAQIAAAAKADLSGGPPDPELANRLRIKHQLADALDKQIGEGGYAAAPEWGAGGGLASGQDAGGDGAMLDDGSGAMPGDEQGAASPAGAAEANVSLPDGSHSSEWTEQDWADLRRMDPATYDAFVAAISGGEPQ